MKTLLNIKFENLFALVFAGLTGMLIYISLYVAEDYRSWILAGLTFIGLFVSYYGIKLARKMLKQVWAK